MEERKKKPPRTCTGFTLEVNPVFWLRRKVMVEASGPRGLALGRERTSTNGPGWTRGSAGGRERGPLAYPLSPARDPASSEQGGTRARGGELRPAPPRTPGAAGLRTARREAPGAPGQGGQPSGGATRPPNPGPGPHGGRLPPPAQDRQERAGEPPGQLHNLPAPLPGPPEFPGRFEAGRRGGICPEAVPLRRAHPAVRVRSRRPAARALRRPDAPRGPARQRQSRRGPRSRPFPAATAARPSPLAAAATHQRPPRLRAPGLRPAHSAKAPRCPVLPQRPGELFPPIGSAAGRSGRREATGGRAGERGAG